MLLSKTLYSYTRSNIGMSHWSGRGKTRGKGGMEKRERGQEEVKRKEKGGRGGKGRFLL